MINKFMKQSPVCSEFSPDDQTYWFDLSRDKVTSHVDTLYYTVEIYNDSNEPKEELVALLDQLRCLKHQKAQNYEAQVDFFGLSVENTRFVHYEYCLKLNENFDIFIASFLPNANTPRIVVQLRTRSLVLDGTMGAVCKSFRYVKEILEAYGLDVGEVKENRIDYAYHTNIIQNPYRYFDDRKLMTKFKSKLRLCTTVKNIGSKIDLSYISFGDRRSNNVFVRVYNKTREVVEKNYKSFFLDKWLEDKLINRYDYYVYSHAYGCASYVTGVLVGRIDWYVEFGHDEEIKKKLLKVKESCYVNSDNTDQLRKIVDRYLSPVTLIMNIEYQTKRRFYHDCEEYIKQYQLAHEELRHGYPDWVKWYEDPLARLKILYALRSEFLDYLTTETLCFVDNKGTDEEKLCYWWQRIHDVMIDEREKQLKFLPLFRERSRQTDFYKAKRKTLSAIAHLALLKQGSLECDTEFSEDLSDVLCALNDNDMHDIEIGLASGELLNIMSKEYGDIKRRKARQNKGILPEKSIKSNSNQSEVLL